MAKPKSTPQNRKFGKTLLTPLAFFAAAMSAPTGHAQTPLTADQAVRIGLDRNPQVMASRAGVAAARASFRSLASLPPVTLGATQQQGRGNDPDTFLNFGEVIDISGQRRYGSAGANEQYRATFYQFHESMLVLEQQIRDGYWTLAAARGQTEIATVSLKEAQRVYDLALKQEQAGSSPKSDVVRSSIDVANAKQTLFAAQGAERSAVITLNVLLAQPPSTPISLASDLTLDTATSPIELPGTEEGLNRMALQNRPILKAVIAQALAAKYTVQQSEASRLPDLTVDFQKSVARSTNNMVFSLSFPLLDFGSVKHSVNAAKELRKQTEAIKVQTEQEVSRQVAQAYTNLKIAIESAASYKKDILDPSLTLLTMAQLGYQQGATGILPIIDAESTIRNARVGYISSLLAVYKAQDEMLAAVGNSSIVTHPNKP